MYIYFFFNIHICIYIYIIKYSSKLWSILKPQDILKNNDDLWKQNLICRWIMAGWLNFPACLMRWLWMSWSFAKHSCPHGHPMINFEILMWFSMGFHGIAWKIHGNPMESSRDALWMYCGCSMHIIYGCSSIDPTQQPKWYWLIPNSRRVEARGLKPGWQPCQLCLEWSARMIG